VTSRKADLAEEAWAALTHVMDVIRDSWMEAARNLELNPGEMKALGALAVDGAQPMGALAKVLRCDASNVTWLADRLEARGLVERHTAPNDRRVKTLSLTDAGRAAHDHVHALLRVPPAPLLALSAAELRTLRDLMTKCWEHAPAEDG
jgi:DNA-binding MarR family transcriptional regulator